MTLSVLGLVVTLLACLGISQAVSERGERVAAAVFAVGVWALMHFVFVMAGFAAEANGWFTR